MDKRKFRRQVAEQIKTLTAWLETGEKSEREFDSKFSMSTLMSGGLQFTRRGVCGDDYIIPCFNGDMVQQEYLCVLQFMIGEKMVRAKKRKGVVYYTTPDRAR